ncbi:MAG: hypothetical protein ACK5P0_02100 [bacterium]
MSLIAKFVSYRPWLNKESKSVPVPTQKEMPDWYKDADRFAKMPNGEYYKAPKEVCPFPKEGTTDDFGKVPTWKACPAIMDAFATGYVFRTPCDLTFFKNAQGIISVKVEDPKCQDFCTQRPPMPQFEHPKGYYSNHFAWSADWGLELPEGYSALFMTPMNRFDLPFLNTTGIVDSDKVHLLGSFPFFIVEGWEGTIPAGTPYLQILPFKRDNWDHEIEISDSSKIYGKIMDNAKTYRQPDGGVYIKSVWSRREYK